MFSKRYFPKNYFPKRYFPGALSDIIPPIIQPLSVIFSVFALLNSMVHVEDFNTINIDAREKLESNSKVKSIYEIDTTAKNKISISIKARS